MVEDNPAEALLFDRALKKPGWPLEVTRLEDGERAIEFLTRTAGNCDLVLLDLNLPRLSGIEVLEQLRRVAGCKSLPIVIVSGSGDLADVERCYRAGANSYVRKPIHVDEIFAMASLLVSYWSTCATLPKRPAAAIV